MTNSGGPRQLIVSKISSVQGRAAEKVSDLLMVVIETLAKRIVS